MTNLSALAHVLLKLLGLYFIIEGVAGAAWAVAYSGMVFTDEVSYVGASTLAYPVAGGIGAATIGDTGGGGVLFCVSQFTGGAQAVVSGDVLKVSVSLSAADS